MTKLVNIKTRESTGVDLTGGASYLGGMADVNAHVARVVADGGGGIDNAALTTLARDVVGLEPTASASLSTCGGTGYKTGKLYSLDPANGTGDFTVTGGGNAVSQLISGLYQINWPANTPRYSYLNGVPSILRESQRQNLITYPRSFSNAYWIKTGATVTGGFSCPFVDVNGINTLEGFKLVENTGLQVHRIQTSFISVSSTQNNYTISLFAKKEERRYIVLVLLGDTLGNRAEVCFDLETGVITNEASVYGTFTNPVAIIKEEVNGYYRTELTCTNDTSERVKGYVYLSNVSNGTAGTGYTGDGTSGIYICHAQLELGASSSSPIYGAEDVTRTRNADLYTVNLPAGTTEVKLTDKNDVVTTDSSPADPYTIPTGEWKSIIMT